MFCKKEIALKRLEICKTCDKNNSNFCHLCNCFMPAKVRFAFSDCPLKKWDRIITEQDKTKDDYFLE